MSAAGTVAVALDRAARLLAPFAGDDARLEAEVLLAHALGIDRAHVIARLRDLLSPGETAAFDALLGRRTNREPLAYVTGHREFYAIDFAVTPEVLIPRPETETLVERALRAIAARDGRALVVDVGTGSGAIAVAIALHAPGARIIATDASPAALAVAERNAGAAGVAPRIEFRQADLLEGVPLVDIIVANLPYVAESNWAALPPELRDWEPRDALVGGTDGTAVIRRFLDQAPAHLQPGGVLIAEIGDRQGAALLAAARRRFPAAGCYIERDFAGLDRMLVVEMLGG